MLVEGVMDECETVRKSLQGSMLGAPIKNPSKVFSVKTKSEEGV
jgi:hypothetical protein